MLFSISIRQAIMLYSLYRKVRKHWRETNERV